MKSIWTLAVALILGVGAIGCTKPADAPKTDAPKTDAPKAEEKAPAAPTTPAPEEKK